PQIDEGDQGQQGPHQGVQEELERRVHAIGSAPYTDDQVHGYEGGFEEDIKQHAVQRGEHAHHQPDRIRKEAMYCDTRLVMTSHPASTTITVMKAVSSTNQIEMPSMPRW